MLASASSALEDLHRTTGIRPQTPIDLYIYANNDDMQNAVLYEPGWTGGQAYPTRNIVIIGIAPEDMEWGKRTLAHELTHVLVGHLAFTCLGDVPTWLNEGIAVYAEGVPEQATVEQLQQAVEDDTLISVRALSGGFSEHPGRADLSYAQSWSLVNFLVKEHGQDKLLALFGALRDGLTIEDALRSTYEFGLEGLERNWRGALKARPRQDTPAAPTPTQLRTPVPTYPPIVAAPEARAEARVAPTLIAATTTSNSTAAAGGTTDSESLQLSGVSPLVYAAIFSFLGLGGVGFWYFFRRRRRT
jgi:hypothetical protein